MFAARLLASIALTLACVAGLGLGSRADAALYWDGHRGIERMNLDGSHRSDVPDLSRFFTGGFIETARGDACAIAVNSTHIYWSNRSSSSIGRANLDGSLADEAFIGAADPCGLAIDDTHVYWANIEADSIGRARLDGTEVEQSFVATDGRPCGVAVDSSYLYWVGGPSGDIRRIDLSTGEIVADFVADADGCGMAVNDSHLYWADLGSRIGRASLDGADVERDLVAGLDRPCAVALDGRHVYWSEESIAQPGSIGRSMLDGSAAQRGFLSDLSMPCGLAVDGLHFTPPPTPVSSFRLGKVRRNVRRGIAFVAMDIPASGHTRVAVSHGLGWRFAGIGYGPSLAGPARVWLRASPARKAGVGLRRRLRRKGRASVFVSVTYSEVKKLPRTLTRRFALVQKRGKRKR